MSEKRQLIDLSIMSIIKFFLVVLALVFFYLIKEVVAILFVALILSSAFDPWIDTLQKIKFPRWLSILLIYVIMFLFIGAVIVLLIPPMAEQFSQLVKNFPGYFEKIKGAFEGLKSYSAEHGLMGQIDSGLNSLKNDLGGAFYSIFSTVAGVFGGIISFFVALVITFYMSVEESAMKKTLMFIIPESYQPFILQLINKVQKKIGDWLKGQLVLSLILGTMVYVGLTILGVEYALVLAFIAAVGEFVPYLGPIMAAVPSVFLAFTQSPTKGLFVFILYIIIQQIENNILVPKVMQKAVGLNPIISITAMLIGAKVAGLVGVIMAIPVATAVSVIIKELCQSENKIEQIDLQKIENLAKESAENSKEKTTCI
ncbi:MAG: AI-2E family transporter [Patescibacteria group bacterium]